MISGSLWYAKQSNIYNYISKNHNQKLLKNPLIKHNTLIALWLKWVYKK